MQRLTAAELGQFVRRFRWNGGRILRVRIRYRSRDRVAVEWRLLVRESVRGLGETGRPVRLLLRLEQVSEFRMQMRPHMPRRIIGDARFSHLNGQFYINLDAWALEPGEQARLHDYRASEAYAAGQELYWQELPPPGPTASTPTDASGPTG